MSQSRYGVALIAGRYELVRELSSNGDVLEWEGFDSALERRVVIYLLRQELVEDRAAAGRFWQAARSSARASAVTGERVLDGGTDPETGRLFVIREWPLPPSPIDNSDTVALPVLTRAHRASAALPSRAGRMALLGLVLVAGVGLSVLRPGVQGWLAWVNEPIGQVGRNFVLAPATRAPEEGAQAGQGARTPAGPQPTVAAMTPQKVTAPQAPTGVATPHSTATPASNSGVVRRIVNTDGRGVALRANPGGERLSGKGYDEGATVMAFERSGDWTRIRGGDGREGWVLSVTLAP